jgi:hypothetical protein
MQDEVIFTDYFARGGDGIILRAQVIDGTPSTSLDIKIDIQTKSSESTTPPTTALGTLTLDAQTAGQLNTVVVAPGASTGLNQQVRLKIYTDSGSAGHWGVIRIFPPIFFNAATA